MAILKPDSVRLENGLEINEYFLTNHNPNKIDIPGPMTKKLIGITVHNTEGIFVGSNTTEAEQYTRATVNGNMNNVRVHYYVDKTCAWQNLPEDYTSWHAADGSGPGNTQTISIECIMKSSGYSASEDNCAKLCAYLCKKYGFTTKDIYTHTYWLNVRDGKYPDMSKDEKCVAKHPYKVCPAYIIPHWKEFLDKVNGYLNPKSKTLYRIQLGAFSDKNNAEKFLADVRKTYPDAFIKEN